MSYPVDAPTPVALASDDVRAAFMVKVYQHLALAVGAFLVFEIMLFMSGAAEALLNFIGANTFGWISILGGVMVANMIATTAASRMDSVGSQYGGLFLLAFAEAVIFAPFLYMVFTSDGGTATVQTAAVITILGFGALSVVGFTTKKDLSFLRPLVMWGGIVAMGLIVLGLLGILQLGVFFSVAMIGLAGAAILYQTQTILRQYPEWAYVSAAIGLFASLMTMFWYVLRLLSRR